MTGRAVDRWIGDTVAAAVCAHHARRMARLGKRPLEPVSGGWAGDAPPPRSGNRVEVLIDGEHALARMVS